MPGMLSASAGVLGCFEGSRQVDVPEASPAVSLRQRIPRLVAGARLEVRMAHADVGTKIWTFVMRTRRLPERGTACLGPGESLPTSC